MEYQQGGYDYQQGGYGYEQPQQAAYEEAPPAPQEEQAYEAPPPEPEAPAEEQPQPNEEQPMDVAGGEPEVAEQSSKSPGTMRAEENQAAINEASASATFSYDIGLARIGARPCGIRGNAWGHRGRNMVAIPQVT